MQKKWKTKQEIGFKENAESKIVNEEVNKNDQGYLKHTTVVSLGTH